MTNADQLVKFVQKQLGDRQFIVAIQREPYQHEFDGKSMKTKKTAGGAHVLMDGILRKVGGTMVALGQGTADAEVVDKKGRVRVPPGQDKYTLKRIFLNEEEMDGFYFGFANQTLWPLCHAVFIRPVFTESWWKTYTEVNRKFADAIIEEIKGDKAFVWINDYHLALVPQMIKEKKPGVTVGLFWHIPWPTHEIFRICPWRNKLLNGMLGSDFIGFHRDYHVDNFIRCCRRELGVLIDTEPRTIIHGRNETKVSNVPAGSDYHEIIEKLDKTKSVTRKSMEKEFGISAQYLAIGVDRIDYTKGLKSRIQIIDRFLEKYPRYIGKFVYLSIGAPSRTKIPEYAKFGQELQDLINTVNAKYAKKEWEPIKFVTNVLPREKIFSYYRLSDVCMVTSLDDGMNLVAKEYVICTPPSKGMLVISKFTGAAKDLSQAVQINPYDLEDSAKQLNTALTMSSTEKRKRNLAMQEVLRENNIYKWGVDFIKNCF